MYKPNEQRAATPSVLTVDDKVNTKQKPGMTGDPAAAKGPPQNPTKDLVDITK